MNQPVLCAEALRLSLRLPSGTLSLLKGIDLNVGPGESVAILGRSGSGKTTLLTVLGLMIRPDSGTLSIQGQCVDDLNESQTANLRNKAIGFVFQNYSLVPHLSVIGNVMLPTTYGTRITRKAAYLEAERALSAVDLGDRGDAHPSALSGGEQQRVAIARALIRKPSVILADEPTGALDVNTGDRVVGLLRDAATTAGACLIIVTHDPAIAAQMDHNYQLVAGHLSPDPRSGPAHQTGTHQ